LLALTGCEGFTTHGEREARHEAGTVKAAYRPSDQLPSLSNLTTNSSLGDFLTFAMLNQPQIEAAYYDWAASVENITVERSLPDPQFTFQLYIQDVITSVMPGLMAQIPWLGKLRAQADAATAESRAKYSAFEGVVLQTAYDVKQGYYQLWFLDKKIAVDREMLQLLSELERIARARNETGQATLQDVYRAQIEADRLKTEIANLEDSRSSLLAQFKAALGLTRDQPNPPLPVRFEATTLDLSEEQILDTAFARNPQLKAMEARCARRRRRWTSPASRSSPMSPSVPRWTSKPRLGCIGRRRRLRCRSGATRSPPKSPPPKPENARHRRGSPPGRST